MQNSTCPFLTFSNFVLCYIYTVPVCTVCAGAEGEAQTAEGQHLSQDTAGAFSLGRAGACLYISILKFCMKPNLKHFSNSWNCQKISLKTFMRSDMISCFIDKTPYGSIGNEKSNDCAMQSGFPGGSIFRPTISTTSSSLSGLQQAFKLL